MAKVRSLKEVFDSNICDVETSVPEFKFEGSARDKARMEFLFERLWESSSARDVILSAIENGYEFSFSPAMSYRGVTNGDKKYLVLNPTEKDDRLVVTLAHELRHAQQFSNGIVKDVKANNIRTEVLKTRAIEADAFAYSILVAHELKNSDAVDLYGNKGDAGPWEELKNTDTILAECFERSYDETGDSTKALYDTFKKWYSHEPITKAYDRILCNKLDIIASEPVLSESASFNQDEHVSSIVKKVCNHNGESYFEDSHLMLLRREYFSVSEDTSKHIAAFFAKREEFKLPVDNTYRSLHVKKDTRVSNDNQTDNVMQFAARKVASRR